MPRIPLLPGRAVRRAPARRRRPLAAVLAACSVWAALHALSPRPPATTTVAVAAHDLPAGSVLRAADVRMVRWRRDAVPDGAVKPPDGAAVSGPVRRGEPFTDVRLVPAAGPARPEGSVLATVRTADPAGVLAVRPGDLVDVLAGPTADPAGPGTSSGPAGDGAVTVARDAVVLEVPGAPQAGGTGQVGAGGTPEGTVGGGLLAGAGDPAETAPVDTSGVLVVAVDRAAAARLAAATGVRSLTVVVVSR